MPKTFDQTGAAFPASGAASTVTTGFSICTGLTHGPTLNKMPGGTAAGVLLSAVGAAASFRFTTPFSDPAQPFNGSNWCTQRFKVRARVESPTTLAAELAVNGAQLLNMNPPTNLGFLLNISNLDAGIRIQVASWVADSTHWQPVWFSFGYDEWVEITLRMLNTNPGAVELFFNGVRVSGGVGNYTGIGASIQWNWPAIAGVVWEFDGPFEQWSGTDVPISPRTELRRPEDEVIRYWTPRNDSRTHPDSSATGLDTIVETVSGSPSYAYAPVATGGINPLMDYVTVTGAGAVERRTWDLGDPLPFKDGWCWWYAPMLYMPSGTTGTLRIQRGSTVLRTVTLSGGSATCNGQSIEWRNTTRNMLAIGIGNMGELDLLVCEQSTFYSQQGCWAMPLANGGEIPDRIVLETSIGSSGFDSCGQVLADTLRVIGVDSMTAAPASTIAAPNFNVGNNICDGLWLSQRAAIPGLRINSNKATVPALCGVPLGRSGLALVTFINYVMPGLNAVRGNVTLDIYEGSVNDLGGITTMAQAITAVDAMVVNDTALKAWSTARARRKLIISTIIERSATNHWQSGPSAAAVAARLAAIRAVNESRRRMFAPDARGRHTLIDVAAMIPVSEHAALINTSNPPHFTTAGHARYLACKVGAELATSPAAVGAGSSKLSIGL